MPKTGFKELKALLFGKKGRAVFYFLLAVGAYLFLPKLPELVTHLLQVIVVITVVNLLERFVLWGEFLHLHREATREVGKSLSQVVASAVDCGLSAIYVNRNKAVDDVKGAITEARQRIWLLGVALAAELSLHELAPILREKFDRTVDVRILLLDPLRSPAVFRTCLESPREEVKQMVYADRSRPGILEPLFWQLVYHDFQGVVDELQLVANSELRKRARFYGHNPNCWLVVVDDKAYFEPYTFGSPPGRAPHERSLGIYMPVFKFEREPATEAFQVLENHFIKLWLSSDTTFLHFLQRWLDRDVIIKDVFARRGKWLREVHEILSQGKGETISCDQDRRAFPRQACNSPIAVRLQDLGRNWASDAIIRDSSLEGISLEVTNPVPPGMTRVELVANGKPATGQASTGAMFLLDWFLNQDYEVARTAGTAPMVVGLRRGVHQVAHS